MYLNGPSVTRACSQDQWGVKVVVARIDFGSAVYESPAVRRLALCGGSESR